MEDLSTISQTILYNLESNNPILVGGKELRYLKETPTQRLYCWGDKKISFMPEFLSDKLKVKSFVPVKNYKKKEPNIHHQLFRTIESELSVDFINANNPFHECSDGFKLYRGIIN